MSVTLTEAAAKHVQSIWPAAAKALACAWASKPPAVPAWLISSSLLIRSNPTISLGSFGVKVLVDEKSLPYLDGTELDYTREGLQEGFKFHNPNEKSRCGCGESFQI